MNVTASCPLFRPILSCKCRFNGEKIPIIHFLFVFLLHEVERKRETFGDSNRRQSGVFISPGLSMTDSIIVTARCAIATTSSVL